MAICSYLVVTADGAAAVVAERLADLPGCEVVTAENRDALVLVTDTADAEAEASLRERIEAFPEIRVLVLTFGEIDPDTPQRDPLAAARASRPGATLPVIDPGAARSVLGARSATPRPAR